MMMMMMLCFFSYRKIDDTLSGWGKKVEESGA